jgi:hypothetical protein
LPLAQGGNAADRLRSLDAPPAAIRRLDGSTGPPERRESRRKENDPPPAVATTFAEELSREVGIGGPEQVVDPIVDLAEEAGTLAGAHAESIHL